MIPQRRWDRDLRISGYDWPGVGFLPSVTALLGRCWPAPELEKWKLRQVAKAWRDGDPLPDGKSAASDWSGTWGLNQLAQAAIGLTAAHRGTAVHQAVHQLLGGEVLEGEVTSDQRVIAGEVLDAMHHAGYEPAVSELSVADPEEGWCGTLDFAGRREGVGWVGDLKTGKGIYETHWIQLAAYASAAVLADGRVFPSVDQVVLVHQPVKGTVAAPKVAGPCQVTVLDCSDRVFLDARERWQLVLYMWANYKPQVKVEG